MINNIVLALLSAASFSTPDGKNLIESKKVSSDELASRNNKHTDFVDYEGLTKGYKVESNALTNGFSMSNNSFEFEFDNLSDINKELVQNVFNSIDERQMNQKSYSLKKQTYNMSGETSFDDFTYTSNGYIELNKQMINVNKNEIVVVDNRVNDITSFVVDFSNMEED